MRSVPRRLARNLLFSLLFLFLLPGLCQGADVLRATLKNGLRVVIVANRLAPVASVQLNYLVGTNEDPEKYPGLAHAVEHMMFRGTPELSAGQLAAIIASLGGEFNAATRQTVTQYYSTVPVEELEVALRMEATRMQHLLEMPEFKKMWHQERGAIEQEVAQKLSNPMFLFYRQLLQKIYAGTPYARTGLGTRESYQRTTAEVLKKFYRTWYGPNNAILIIVGDVEPQKTLAAVTRLFQDLEAEKVPAPPRITLQPLQPASIQMETDLPYSMAMVNYRLPGFSSSDYAAGQVLADVLNSERAKLYGLVPEGAALGAGFSIMDQAPASIGQATAIYPKGGDGQQLVARLKQIIEEYRQKGIPAELVEAAKRREIAAAEFRKNSINGLAMLWSEAVAIEGQPSPEVRISEISRVSVDDVNRVARAFLNNNTAITAVLVPRAAGQPAAGETAQGPGEESFAPRETEQVSLPAWAEGAKVASLPPMPPEAADMLLDNGLRLIVLPQDISPTITLYGMVQHNADLQEPPGKEGVDQVLGELFAYGTQTLDRLAFQKALDEIAARESAGTSFSLQVLADQFDRGVELLASHLLQPALPRDAFEIVRSQTAAALAGELQSPNFLARQALKTSLFPEDDPTLRHATPETVKALSLEDVKAYYRQVFRPDLTSIVIIGRISPEQARAAVARHFGSWRATGPRPETHLPPVPPNAAAARRITDPSRVQDAVILAETVGLTRSSPDYYPLQLGRHVLAGGFYATRLYRDLREKTGLVYSVAAQVDAGKNRTVFLVFFGSDPEKVDEARAIVVRNLRAMQQSPLSDDELQQAKTLLLRQIALGRSSVDNLAHRWLSLIQLDLPLDEPQKAAARYRTITAQEVQQAFARHIRPEALVRVIQGPPLGAAK